MKDNTFAKLAMYKINNGAKLPCDDVLSKVPS